MFETEKNKHIVYKTMNCIMQETEERATDASS